MVFLELICFYLEKNFGEKLIIKKMLVRGEGGYEVLDPSAHHEPYYC